MAPRLSLQYLLSLTSPKTREVHLFLLWERTRLYEARILSDIAANFAVVDVLEVEWAPNQFSRNLRV